jgi:hypothetical protein
VNAESREERRQAHCPEGAIARVPENHRSPDENDHRYGKADIRVANRPFHLLTHADKSPRNTIAQDQVNESERGSNAAADISTGKRAFLDVDFRRSSNQAQDSRSNACKHHTRADRRRQRLGRSRERSDLRNRHARTMSRPNARMARKTQRI